MPLSRIVERTGEAAVLALLARLHEFDWVVMVSPGAIRAASQAALATWPDSIGVAVVGPGSLQALRESGLPLDPARILCPREPPFDADALLALAPLDAPAGLRIAVLRGMQGNDRWIERLRERGATVETCALYRNEPLAAEDGAIDTLRAWLSDAALPVFVVAQLSAVDRLEALLALADLREAAHEAPALAIHPRIVAALSDAGWVRAQAVEPGEVALGLALESASPSSSQHRA